MLTFQGSVGTTSDISAGGRGSEESLSILREGEGQKRALAFCGRERVRREP